MNTIGILSSLNFIGLIAFVITLAFLIYEIFMLSRGKKNQEKPEVPNFEESAHPLPINAQLKESNWQIIAGRLKKNDKLMILILTILLIFFGGLSIFGSFRSESQSLQFVPVTPTIIVNRNLIPTIKISAVPSETFVSQVNPTFSISETIETPTIEPTQVIVTETDSPTPGEEIMTEETESQISPTAEIRELPITSNIYNSIILFSVAGVFLFFSFMF